MSQTRDISTQMSAQYEIESQQSKVPAKMPRVVIIGAGFGGLQAAHALRNAPVDLTVIDRNNHHLFQPLLYQVATAGLSPADICVPIRFTLRNKKTQKCCWPR